MIQYLYISIVGDPTVYGWAMTAVFAIAAVLCATAAMRSHSWRERAFWCVSAILTAALALNKQLDLQTAMRNFAKRASDQVGLADRNDELQIVVVIVLAAVTAAATSVLFVVVRSMFVRLRIAVFGLVTLLCFALLRAAIIEQAAPANDLTLGVARSLEILGSLLLIWGALRREKSVPAD